MSKWSKHPGEGETVWCVVWTKSTRWDEKLQRRKYLRRSGSWCYWEHDGALVKENGLCSWDADPLKLCMRLVEKAARGLYFNGSASNTLGQNPRYAGIFDYKPDGMLARVRMACEAAVIKSQEAP